ncbi:MAG: hypothetical protein ACK559_30180, partial [bacterium]
MRHPGPGLRAQLGAEGAQRVHPREHVGGQGLGAVAGQGRAREVPGREGGGARRGGLGLRVGEAGGGPGRDPREAGLLDGGVVRHVAGDEDLHVGDAGDLVLAAGVHLVDRQAHLVEGHPRRHGQLDHLRAHLPL